MSEYGIENEDDLAEFREFRRQKEAARKAVEQEHINSHSDSEHSGNDDNDLLFDDSDECDTSEEMSSSQTVAKRTNRKATTDVIKEIARRTKNKDTKSLSAIVEDDKDADEDEFMPSTVDYSKKIERAKEKVRLRLTGLRTFKSYITRLFSLHEKEIHCSVVQFFVGNGEHK